MTGIFEALVLIAAGSRRSGTPIYGNKARELARRALAEIGRGWGDIHGPTGLREGVPESDPMTAAERAACAALAYDWMEIPHGSLDISSPGAAANQAAREIAASIRARGDGDG